MTEELTVERSACLGEASARFGRELHEWACTCVGRYAGETPTDGHDQLTYTTAWESYLRQDPDEQLIEFLLAAQQRTAEALTARGLWRHGYWRMQEAHHGTEHFELFLGFMARILPGEQSTGAQLLDAAEHLGNWSPEVPEWFDYSTGLFKSLFFGAEGVRNDDGMQLNMPDHLRCVRLLLLAHEVAGDPAFRDLAVDYGERWAEAIAGGEDLPLGLSREGPVYRFAGHSEQAYRSFAGMAGTLRTPLDRAENILASGGIQLFLDLWRESERTVFLEAVERLLAVLAEALTDPDAGVAADAFRAYRRTTGNRRYDVAVLAAVANLKPDAIHRLAMDASAPRAARRPPGVGKRADALRWFEDGRPRRVNPVTIAVAAEIREDSSLAVSALDLARTYLALARRHLPDGRDHGCAAQTVNAVARGHGRENHVGMATGVLQPLTDYFGR